MNRRRVGALLVGLIFTAALVGYFYTPHDPNQVQILLRFKPPSWEHPWEQITSVGMC